MTGSALDEESALLSGAASRREGAGGGTGAAESTESLPVLDTSYRQKLSWRKSPSAMAVAALGGAVVMCGMFLTVETYEVKSQARSERSQASLLAASLQLAVDNEADLGYVEMAFSNTASGADGNSDTMFEMLDADDSSALEPKEVEGIMRLVLGKRDDTEEAVATLSAVLFEVMDLDGDGVISQPEFATLSQACDLLGAASASSDVDYEVAVSTWNAYTESQGPAGEDYPFFSAGGFRTLVEPHRVHHFQAGLLNSATGNEIGADAVLWVVDGAAMAHARIAYQFEHLGTHSITVSILSVDSDDNDENDDTVVLAKDSFKVVCKYVRRELRELTESDRSKMLDAAQTMWLMDEQAGKSAYGEKYWSIETFTILHAELAGDQKADHMHDGMGFANHHTALSMMFEMSMQAVDSSVSLPYWDYSIDCQRIEDKHGGDYTYFMEGDLWDADVFGKASPDLNYVTEGRWAYTKVMSGAWDKTHNSYGYLRAPWNNNPSPYVTRSSTMCGATWQEYAKGFDYWQYPSCSVMYELENDMNTYKDYLRFLPYGPHGSIHALIGGVTQCSGTFDKLAAMGLNVTDVNRFRSVVFNGLKDMFREGHLSMPERCSIDDGFEDCHATCKHLDHYIETQNTTMLDTYLDLIDFWGFTSDLAYSTRIEVLKVICDGGLNAEGEQLEAGSPMDISFWPIHPAVDRLFQWKALTGTMTDWEWPTSENYWGTFGKTGLITGHQPTDVLPYDLRPYLPTGYTNVELLNMTRPDRDIYRLPYVYGHFRWDHCKAAGYDIAGINASTAGNAGDIVVRR